MKTMWLFLLLLGSVSVLAAITVIEPTPDQYLTGPVSRDVASALARGKSEHRPVFVIAWDKKFKNSPEGKTVDTANYHLHFYFQNPETKKLVASNFVQAWTTLDCKAISQFIDPADKTHVPVIVVFDADGNFVGRMTTGPNAEDALKDVQKMLTKLAAQPPTDVAARGKQ